MFELIFYYLNLVFWAAYSTGILHVLTAAGIAYGLSAVLTKKPHIEKPGIQDITISGPSARPYPMILGTPPTMQSPEVIAWWNRAVYPFEKHDEVIAYLYYVTHHMGYCQSGVDGIIQFWARDTVVWPTVQDDTDFAADGTTSVQIDASAVWGGMRSGGGFETIAPDHFTIEYGGAAQTCNALITAEYGADMPGNRGFVGLVGRWRFYPSGQMPCLQPLIRSTEKAYDGTDIWYKAKARIGTFDINPIHAIYKLLSTPTDYGGEGRTDFNETEWQAAADTCYTEGLGISAYYYAERDELHALVDAILQVIDGTLRYDYETGELGIKLIREDYTIADLPIYTHDDCEIVEFERPSVGDMPSRVILRYSNRLRPQIVPTPVEYFDAALQQRQGGRTVEHQMDMPIICDPDIAQIVVDREGPHRASLGPRLNLRCKRTMSGLRPGDVFVLSYNDDDLTIIQMICRVGPIALGNLANQNVTIHCVEDVWGSTYTIMGSPGTEWSYPGAVASATWSASPSTSPSASASSSPSSSASAT